MAPPSSPATSALLVAERLGRTVAGKAIVQDVCFEVRRSEVVAIVGPSGAGKSSLLRLFNRLDEPTTGTVYLEGQDYRTLPPRQLRYRVGMVMQAPYLFPGTVADNVQYGPREHGQPLAPEAVDELLAQVELPGYAPRTVDGLSGGEAQRVALARALANRPQILLLDEPTAALDEETKAEIEQLLRQVIREQALTCLMVTHDLDQARRLADRIVLMEQGRVVKIGPVEEVLHAKRAV